ncbi:FadR/GntR family transcriptional regulator [Microlunatus flavus]|uniref:GntR family transcriptional regulator, transcriptional repressor for pyruvate dehydrogenase complex n=1 Tax=Microlunatus flavus TaxID=1036181 RepID=A0A1H9B1T2_9ACTN|nr:FadR/GntR family transcriptional regulator [Microlunatus flavus]SEP82785.1 GntR family transcriptional regulator, transcriptional repressor for pyruvate dehydrogenase complex [Microlunatus flavus]
MAAPLTEAAIERVRHLIISGRLVPGERLPAEAELSAELGVSRSSLREAVRGLVTAGVLDVRRGDGTYVTSLTPHLLLTGIQAAVELMQEDSILDLIESRRLIEPGVTALAAVRSSAEQRAEMARHIALMAGASAQKDLIRHDTDFHATVARASHNPVLASVLTGISSGTVRTRVWRGIMDAEANHRTVEEHRAILAAIEAGDANLAEAAALVHVASVESWLQTMVASGETEPDEASDPDADRSLTSV